MKVKKESEKADSKLNIQEAKIMASGPITSYQIGDETTETVTFFFFLWVPKSLQIMTAAMKLKDPCSLEENYYKPRQNFKKHKHYLAEKCWYNESYCFSSNHVWM